MNTRRGVRRVKVWWLVAAFFSGFALAVWAQELILTVRDNRLQFAAPGLHFLAGKPLDRLRNAAEVPFDFQVTLWAGNRNRELRRAAATFVVSYDLWEEKFSVTKLSTPRKRAAHLTMQAAEAWCLEQMPMDASGLGPAEPFWVRLEVRAPSAKAGGPLFARERITETGVSLNRVVEIFSRPAQTDQPHWTVDAGPLTLNEVRRGPGSPQ